MWKVKDIKEGLSAHANKNFRWKIKWEIIEKAAAYRPGSKICNLCTAEKHHILNENDSISLNVRSELLSKCRHMAKWKLFKLHC